MKKFFAELSFSIRNDRGLQLSMLCGFIALALCQICRLILFFGFADFFAPVSAGTALRCFFQGMVFDASICVSIMGLPLLLMNIPGTGRKWLKGCAVFFTVIFTIFAILMAADLFYFPEAHRHIGAELKWIFNEMGFFVSFAFTKGLPALVGVIIFTGAMSYGLMRFAGKESPNAEENISRGQKIAYNSVKIFLLIAVLFLLQRGGFVRKNVGVADVFKYARTNEEAVLVMNGVFSAVNISRKKTLSVSNDFPYEEALDEIKGRILSKNEEWSGGEKYPFARKSEREMFKGKKLNVFFVMLEAWKYDSIDGLTGGKTGDTPNFDNIIKEGLVFTNAFAVGTRSIYGFSGIFASLPLAPGLPVFGYGLELNAFSPVFRLFGENGYSTYFSQASHSDSYRMCSLALAMGADGSWGWEDMPQLLPYSFTPDYGYDHEALQFAAGKAVKAIRQPQKGKTGNFFSAVFTATTHAPFGNLLEDGRFSHYPNDSWEHGYQNSLRYSDWSIGELISRAKKEEWHDDTVFIFMSDHTQHVSSSSDYEVFRVPLVIYSPKNIKPGTRDYVVSQLDILPTLVEIGGIRQPFSSMGRSIFDEDRPQDRFAVTSYGGDDFGIITSDGAMRHNLKKITAFENQSGKADEKEMERLLKAAHQAFYKTMNENRWGN